MSSCMDIAIIGFSGTFPQAPNPLLFWQNLMEQKDCARNLPMERFKFLSSAKMERDKVIDCLKDIKCAYMDDYSMFDHDFFGISKKEAIRIDPQQRLICEQSYLALENAHLRKEDISGTETGVVVGVSSHDYSYVLLKNDDIYTPYSATGSGRTFIANRVSHFFDLKGPSLTIDTACSSSATSIFIACNLIYSGLCEMCICGGSNVIADPYSFLSFANTNILSKSGSCKVFDSRADGFIRGEGVGVVVLKKLDLAVKDGNQILAVIKEIACNHQGKNHSITAPSLKSQVELFQKVYNENGIDPGSISYIEAGSNGTSLGDPIEIRALKTVFSSHTGRENFCTIGSIKGNYGHLEAAAAICGLIRILLSLKNEVIPGLANFVQPNKFIDFSHSPFCITTENKPWPKNERSRRAALTSFGFGGSNVHIVVEDYHTNNTTIRKRRLPKLFLSFPDQDAFNLNSSVNDFLKEQKNGKKIDAFCFTYNISKSQFHNYRSVLSFDKNKTEKCANHEGKLRPVIFDCSNFQIDLSQIHAFYENEVVFEEELKNALETFEYVFCPSIFQNLPENNRKDDIAMLAIQSALLRSVTKLCIKPAALYTSLNTIFPVLMSQDIIKNENFRNAKDKEFELFPRSVKSTIKTLIGLGTDRGEFRNFKDIVIEGVVHSKNQSLLNYLQNNSDEMENSSFDPEQIRANYKDPIIVTFGRNLKSDGQAEIISCFDTDAIIESIFLGGHNVDFKKYYRGFQNDYIDIPSYVFNRKQCLIQ
jgi:3-oxoacyl-(acyl-carrier-protein) synthase